MKQLLSFICLSVMLFTSSYALQVGESFENLTLKDQFDQKYTIDKKSKKLLFAFSKDNGHVIKEFMEDKPSEYLQQKNITFIADISAMPSIIASWFAIPDMKKSKYPILLIRDDEISAKYKDETKKEFFMIVELENQQIKDIKYLQGKENITKWIQEN